MRNTTAPGVAENLYQPAWEFAANGGTMTDLRSQPSDTGNLTYTDNGDPGFYIPVGSSAQRTLNFSDDGNKCGTAGYLAIAFVPLTRTGINTGADMVWVHRDDASTWTVTTQADETDPNTLQTIHHDKAYCAGNGQLYHMPLRLTIRMSTALTP